MTREEIENSPEYQKTSISVDIFRYIQNTYGIIDSDRLSDCCDRLAEEIYNLTHND